MSDERIPPSPEDEAELAKLTAELVEGAKVKNPGARRMLAEQAAILHLQLRSLHRRRAAGKISSEAERTIPSVASSLKRALEELGHLGKLAGDDDDEEADGFAPPGAPPKVAPKKK